MGVGESSNERPVKGVKPPTGRLYRAVTHDVAN
jgi:hypothetical protein